MDETNLQEAIPAEGANPLPEETPVNDSAPPTETAEASDTPADDAGKPEPKGVGKRIDELTRLRRDAERDRDYWRDFALRQQPQSQTTPPAETKTPAAIPTLAEFEYDETKYQAALLQYTESVAERKVEAVLKAERDRQAQEATQKTWRQRESEFKAKTPDYESIAYYAPISNEVASLIVKSDIGPELAYHLGKNPEIAENISKLPQVEAAKEIGRLEATLSFKRETAAKPAPKPVVSQAPPPPPKLEAAEPEVSRDPDAMSVDEWLKWRNKQLNRKKA